MMKIHGVSEVNFMKVKTDLTASKQVGQPGYMIQLDALRALAVFGVLIAHFAPPTFFLNSIFHSGELGVQLFFLLSGFLITGILLQCRERVDLGNQDVGYTIKIFYIRRFLRLMPIYYLVIAIAIIINIEPIKNSPFWYLTYTSNIYNSIIGHWDEASHLWSLAVEEQFYLFWPWFIFFLPKKHLLKFMIIAFAIGPFSRFLCIAFGLNPYWRWTLPFTNLDPLAMGGILAFLNYQTSLKQYKIYLCKLGFWLGIPLLIFLRITESLYRDNVFYEVFFQTSLCLFFVWLVAHAAQGFGGVIGTVLEIKPLIYIGKISYGIYLCHYFMLTIIPRIFDKIGLPYPNNIFLEFVLMTVFSLLIASLSWHLIEKPINNLKRHFKYTKKALS